MNAIYRKPSIHVAGITSILLKGFVGLGDGHVVLGASQETDRNACTPPNCACIRT